MKRTFPAWWSLAVVAALGALAMRNGPVSDVDLFWHIRVGDLLRQHLSFPYPDPWAYTVPDHHWHSTAWLSEIVLSLVHQAAGFTGIVALRLVLTLAFLAALFRVLVVGSHDRIAPVVYVITVLPAASYFQERPQTASLVFLVWLAARLRGFLEQDRPPHRWRTVAVIYVWACIHGLFVLAPGVLVLLGLCRLRSESRDTARSTLVTGALAGVAAGLTPMGPRLLLAPFTVGSAARGFIVEWAPTNIEVFGALGLFVFLALLLLGYARSAVPVPATELVVVLALGTFGLLAIRNAGPVSILLAPIVVRRLRAWRSGASTLTLPVAPVAALLSVALLAVGASFFTHPALDDQPTRIADYLAAAPAGSRVLNDYNSSGYLIYRDGGHVLLSIDGRADRYGAKEIGRYQRAVQGDPSWREYVHDLRPDYAVVDEHSALVQLLQAVDGWQRVLTDRHLVLLRSPRTR